MFTHLLLFFIFSLPIQLSYNEINVQISYQFFLVFFLHSDYFLFYLSGVLPEKPNSRIMAYVRQYANSPADVREFERQWYLTVKKQLDKKHERIRTESREATAYEKNEAYYKQCVIPHLTDETTFLKISHWHFMPEDIHRERMDAIKNNTIWSQFVVNSSLRINPRIANSHEEFYELRLPEAKNMSSAQYRELYKNCCAHLGFDHRM